MNYATVAKKDEKSFQTEQYLCSQLNKHLAAGADDRTDHVLRNGDLHDARHERTVVLAGLGQTLGEPMVQLPISALFSASITLLSSA